MTAKRAAIYIRVSSEHQAEKASPEEQEADCRTLAAQHGLTVVKVYRDVEKYRVKRRLFEPSATRTDRPGLVSMLQAGEAGEFEVILAWKEDRLYRGLRPMLNVLDVIQKNRLSVMLARESFDEKMAPIKAWVAGMELDSMRERMTMGVKARLRAGKANCGQDLYGYVRRGEVYELVPEEAMWVVRIFDWYNERVPLLEIRRRLIEANAPQKGSSVPRKIRWATTSIRSILKHSREYATGIKHHRRGGEVFEIPVPTIIDHATHEAACKVREYNTKHRIHNLKRDYLLLGLMHCQCERTWQVRANSYTRRNRQGEKVPRKTYYPMYFCGQRHPEHVHATCPRTIGGRKADEHVWGKVCEVLDNPDLLIAGARQQVDELRQQAEQAAAESARLNSEIEAALTERQWVITQARKGKITADDMDTQLAALAIQEAGLRREMASHALTVELTALDGWEAQVRDYLADIRLGLESLNAPPQSDEEAHEQALDKRRIVQTLVEQVTIGQGREMRVVFRLDVLAAIKQLADSPIGETKQAGICNPMFDLAAKLVLRVTF